MCVWVVGGGGGAGGGGGVVGIKAGHTTTHQATEFKVIGSFRFTFENELDFL